MELASGRFGLALWWHRCYSGLFVIFFSRSVSRVFSQSFGYDVNMVYLEHRRRFGFPEAQVILLEFLSSEVRMKRIRNVMEMFDG